MSGADLARVALLTPQTVGVIIRNLERDGAIRKTPHPVHGRVLQWTLTRRGATLLDKCRRHAHGAGAAAGGRALGAKAQATVRRWLSKIATDLRMQYCRFPRRLGFWRAPAAPLDWPHETA